MAARVIFSKKSKHRNGYLDDFPGDKDYEGECSDEEDVFVEDPILDIAGATKPLMHPRKRTKVTSRTPECKCRVLFRPILYFLLLVIALGGLMLLILYLIDKYKHQSDSMTQNFYDANSLLSTSVIGCDTVEVEDVWVVGMPKLLTESAFRLVDINKDGVLDIIFGFATGADGYGIPEVVCDIYFNGTRPCLGGLIALEGMTGRELWRHYSEHELYGINCNVDLNGDGIKDCLSGGRAGAFEAISGKDGLLIWTFDDEEARNSIMNLYTAQLIPDVDGDGVPDVLAVHGGDPLQDPGSAYRLSGRLVLFSGKTGTVLQWVGVPDKREAYYSPQVYTQLDGSAIVLFGTGGETHAGSLWRISLDHLLQGEIEKAEKIYSDSHKGVMTPPVLVDITGDHVVDIILPMFNSTVIAVDGRTFQLLWNYSFPMSESYNTPSAGFYNDDDVPDFMVMFSHGPGFPIYYDSQTTVLDGRTGTPLIVPSMKDTVGAQASPLTISIEGYGNDLFLHWVADCEEHEGEGGEFQFVKGTNVHEQSRSDFCRLRFKTNGFSKMYATGRNIGSPGVAVYYSAERVDVEKSVWINTTEEAIDFVRKHPEHLANYEYFGSLSDQAKAEKPYNKYKPAEDSEPDHHRGEFISENAHYRNQQTSTSSKKGQRLQDRPQNPSRQRIPNQYPRIPDDRDRTGNRRRPTIGTGSRGRPMDRNGWQDNGRYPDRPAYGNDRSDTDQYWYNRPPLQNNPYYPPVDDDYEDEDNYRRYPPYKYSPKRSNKSEKSQLQYHYMKHKRSVSEAQTYRELFSRENLQSLENKLHEEYSKRHRNDKKPKRYFMKRRKRSNEKYEDILEEYENLKSVENTRSGQYYTEEADDKPKRFFMKRRKRENLDHYEDILKASENLKSRKRHGQYEMEEGNDETPKRFYMKRRKRANDEHYEDILMESKHLKFVESKPHGKYYVEDGNEKPKRFYMKRRKRTNHSYHEQDVLNEYENQLHDGNKYVDSFNTHDENEEMTKRFFMKRKKRSEDDVPEEYKHLKSVETRFHDDVYKQDKNDEKPKRYFMKRRKRRSQNYNDDSIINEFENKHAVTGDFKPQYENDETPKRFFMKRRKRSESDTLEEHFENEYFYELDRANDKYKKPKRFYMKRRKRSQIFSEPDSLEGFKNTNSFESRHLGKFIKLHNNETKPKRFFMKRRKRWSENYNNPDIQDEFQNLQSVEYNHDDDFKTKYENDEKPKRYFMKRRKRWSENYINPDIEDEFQNLQSVEYNHDDDFKTKYENDEKPKRFFMKRRKRGDDDVLEEFKNLKSVENRFHDDVYTQDKNDEKPKRFFMKRRKRRSENYNDDSILNEFENKHAVTGDFTPQYENYQKPKRFFMKRRKRSESDTLEEYFKNEYFDELDRPNHKYKKPKRFFMKRQKRSQIFSEPDSLEGFKNTNSFESRHHGKFIYLHNNNTKPKRFFMKRRKRWSKHYNNEDIQDEFENLLSVKYNHDDDDFKTQYENDEKPKRFFMKRRKRWSKNYNNEDIPDEFENLQSVEYNHDDDFKTKYENDEKPKRFFMKRRKRWSETYNNHDIPDEFENLQSVENRMHGEFRTWDENNEKPKRFFMKRRKRGQTYSEPESLDEFKNVNYFESRHLGKFIELNNNDTKPKRFFMKRRKRWSLNNPNEFPNLQSVEYRRHDDFKIQNENAEKPKRFFMKRRKRANEGNNEHYILKGSENTNKPHNEFNKLYENYEKPKRLFMKRRKRSNVYILEKPGHIELDENDYFQEFNPQNDKYKKPKRFFMKRRKRSLRDTDDESFENKYFDEFDRPNDKYKKPKKFYMKRRKGSDDDVLKEAEDLQSVENRFHDKFYTPDGKEEKPKRFFMKRRKRGQTYLESVSPEQFKNRNYFESKHLEKFTRQYDDSKPKRYFMKRRKRSWDNLKEHEDIPVDGNEYSETIRKTNDNKPKRYFMKRRKRSQDILNEFENQPVDENEHFEKFTKTNDNKPKRYFMKRRKRTSKTNYKEDMLDASEHFPTKYEMFEEINRPNDKNKNTKRYFMKRKKRYWDNILNEYENLADENERIEKLNSKYNIKPKRYYMKRKKRSEQDILKEYEILGADENEHLERLTSKNDNKPKRYFMKRRKRSGQDILKTHENIPAVENENLPEFTRTNDNKPKRYFMKRRKRSGKNGLNENVNIAGDNNDNLEHFNTPNNKRTQFFMKRKKRASKINNEQNVRETSDENENVDKFNTPYDNTPKRYFMKRKKRASEINNEENVLKTSDENENVDNFNTPYDNTPKQLFMKRKKRASEMSNDESILETSDENVDKFNTPYDNKPKRYFMKRKKRDDVEILKEFEQLQSPEDILEEFIKQNNEQKTPKRFFMKRKKREGTNNNEKENSNSHEKMNILHRERRHIGPHDNHGLQRLLSTGTVAPTTLPLDHPDYNQTVDIIFATYWFFPAKTQAILPQDQKCISDKLAEAETRFDPKSHYYGLDEDSYEHAITQECLKQSDHQLHDNGVYESQTTYNPYDVHMGQMTVYRIRLKCTCSNATLSDPANQGKRCSRILPYDKQQWPAYMGRNADSLWLPRT